LSYPTDKQADEATVSSVGTCRLELGMKTYLLLFDMQNITPIGTRLDSFIKLAKLPSELGSNGLMGGRMIWILMEVRRKIMPVL